MSRMTSLSARFVFAVGAEARWPKGPEPAVAGANHRVLGDVPRRRGCRGHHRDRALWLGRAHRDNLASSVSRIARTRVGEAPWPCRVARPGARMRWAPLWRWELESIGSHNTKGPPRW